MSGRSTLQGEFIDRALNHTRALPSVDPPHSPDQSVLDQTITATSQPVD